MLKIKKNLEEYASNCLVTIPGGGKAGITGNFYLIGNIYFLYCVLLYHLKYNQVSLIKDNFKQQN